MNTTVLGLYTIFIRCPNCYYTITKIKAIL